MENQKKDLKKTKRNPDEMNDHDLLAELIRAQRRTAKFQMLTAVENVVLILGIIVIFVVLVPRAVTALDSFNNTMQEVSDLASSTRETVDQLSTDATKSLNNIDGMIENVDTLVQDNTEGLTKALNNVNDIDFDSLNDAIGSLKSSAEQLRKITDLFG